MNKRIFFYRKEIIFLQHEIYLLLFLKLALFLVFFISHNKICRFLQHLICTFKKKIIFSWMYNRCFVLLDPCLSSSFLFLMITIHFKKNSHKSHKSPRFSPHKNSLIIYFMLFILMTIIVCR